MTSAESCVSNELKLKVSDAWNEMNKELRARRVFSRLPASSASSDEQDGKLLKDRVAAMHERKNQSLPWYRVTASVTQCPPALFGKFSFVRQLQSVGCRPQSQLQSCGRRLAWE